MASRPWNWLCQGSLPVKEEFFLPSVTKCDHWDSLSVLFILQYKVPSDIFIKDLNLIKLITLAYISHLCCFLTRVHYCVCHRTFGFCVRVAVTSDQQQRTAWLWQSVHGYQGLDFQKNLIVDPFELVDLYPLMCHLLGMNPTLHDGHLNSALWF